MGVLFESILLFSLAVLIILVGLLVYYFKKRIVEIEQKNAKCLEIAQDVYMQQMQMKKEIYSVLFQQQPSHQPHDDRIRVVLSEDEKSVDSESDESDSDSDSESDNDSVNKVKIVNVNLKYPEECDITIDCDELESDDESVDDEIVEHNNVSLEKTETIVVSKVENTEEPPKKTSSKDELQKMSPASLKSLLISKGISAESVNKMKKKDLVDMLFSLVE
jgi:hypothetical protein